MGRRICTAFVGGIQPVPAGDVDSLGLVRLFLGWPFTVVLLIFTYLYGLWRLRNLGGPSVEEFKPVMSLHGRVSAAVFKLQPNQFVKPVPDSCRIFKPVPRPKSHVAPGQLLLPRHPAHEQHERLPHPCHHHQETGPHHFLIVSSPGAF